MHDECFILLFPGSFSYSDVPSYADESRVVRVLYVKSGIRKNKSKRLKNNFYAFSTHISPNIYFFRMLFFT